jgi:hypothetical protein
MQGVLVLANATASGFFRAESRGKLEFKDRALFFDGRCVVAGERFGTPRVTSDDRGCVVRFEDGLRAEEIRLPEIEASRLLAVMGFAARPAAAHREAAENVFWLPSPLVLNRLVLAMPLACTLLGFLAFSVLGVAGGTFDAVVLVAMCLPIVPLALRSRLVVADDGIRVSWFGRTNFYSYVEIQRAALFDVSGGLLRVAAGGVELALSGGRRHRLAVARSRVGVNEDSRTRILKQIREARARHFDERGALAALLDRGADGDGRRWIELLQAVASGANEDHRTAPVSIASLFRIAEDEGAPPRQRIAATVALVTAPLDDEERERLGTVGRSTRQRLRRAFDAARRRDDEGIIESLAEIERHEKPKESSST